MAGVTVHVTAGGLQDDHEGFVTVHCSCGWRDGPFPDEETAIDALMEHAYSEGFNEAAQGVEIR